MKAAIDEKARNNKTSNPYFEQLPLQPQPMAAIKTITVKELNNTMANSNTNISQNQRPRVFFLVFITGYFPMSSK